MPLPAVKPLAVAVACAALEHAQSMLPVWLVAKTAPPMLGVKSNVVPLICGTRAA